MNCCGHDQDGKRQENKHKKHMLMMLLCCGLPVLILLLLPLISGPLPGITLVIGSIAPFLCPVMMIAMMFFMHRDGRSDNTCHGDTGIKQLKEKGNG